MSEQQTQTQSRLVKIHWNNELRLLPCNLNNFQELIQQCAARFEVPAEQLTLSYQDECTDTITVTTDADLQAALVCFSQANVRPKFSLVRKEAISVAAPTTTKCPTSLPIKVHPCLLRRPLNVRGPIRLSQPATTTVAVPPAAPAPQPPKTEAEKKQEKRQKKQALRLQKLNSLKATRIVRLRWKEPVEIPAPAEGQAETPKKPLKQFKGCYFGVEWKSRALTFECGKGLKSLWFLRQLKDGDVVLSSMTCPNRFLRMNKLGVLEFNTGENGPWARWNLLDSATGEKLNNNDRKLVETLANGTKVHLASKTVVGKFIGQQSKPSPLNPEKVQLMAVGAPEGLVFTIEVVEALKANQLVKLCCDGVNLVDPKTEDKEKKEKKGKKLEEAKKQKEKEKETKQSEEGTEKKEKKEKKEKVSKVVNKPPKKN